NFYSRLWEPPLHLAERLGLARRTLYQNWLTAHDVNNLLGMAGFETIRHWAEILWPCDTPLVAPFLNRWLVKLWRLRCLALPDSTLARPRPEAFPWPERPVGSVVVPARSEAGNVPAIFDRVPEMGGATEIVFGEGHSSDNTNAAAEAAIASHPQ